MVVFTCSNDELRNKKTIGIIDPSPVLSKSFKCKRIYKLCLWIHLKQIA